MTLPARRRYGQNFLHDANVIARILKAISPGSDEHFLEIGGGLGALTIPLARLVARLDVVEIDSRLVETLQAHFGAAEHVAIHHADALSFDVARCAQDEHELRVAGNLPYNISTPLLFHLATFKYLIRDMHFMLQKEVVDRMVATPGSKTYGRLTVMLSRWFDIEACFDIRPGSFRPQPRVMSTLVRMTVRDKPRFAVADEQRFAAVVAHLFSMRRKTLGRALRGHMAPGDLAKLGIDPMARAETLSPERLAALADAVQ